MVIRLLTNAMLIDAKFSKWAVTPDGNIRDAEGTEFTVEEFTSAIATLDARVAEIKEAFAQMKRMAEAAKSQPG